MAPLEMLENESGTDSDDRMALKESTFDLNHRLSQELTAPLLINTLTFVLESYRTNSAQLNASVVGVLKRIVLPDCLNLMPCVWHLSFLLVAEKILGATSLTILLAPCVCVDAVSSHFVEKFRASGLLVKLSR